MEEAMDWNTEKGEKASGDWIVEPPSIPSVGDPRSLQSGKKKNSTSTSTAR